MRPSFVLLAVLSLAGCRLLRPGVPQVTPARPGLLSTSDLSDPTRTPTAMPARRCVVDCAPGYRCNDQTAECEADPDAGTPDSGVSWLP